MTNPVATSRAAPTACLSTERIRTAIDDILDLRLRGTSSEWTDPELVDLWSELRRRELAGAHG